MNVKGGPKKKKNVSYFSHEYIIANHGDIFSFIAMIIVLGLMFQATAPLASLFIVLHHNVTINDSVATPAKNMIFYTPGRRDIFATIFYTIICIVVHAVIQEYGLDKLNRKLHLSKTKHSKFNESGQLLVFYFVSAIWAANIIYTEKSVISLSSIWEGYPHVKLAFWVKFFYLFQICYWLHSYAELYLQQIKKEEMLVRVTYITLYLFAVVGVYVFNFNRLGLLLLLIHYSVEFIFHGSRLLYFANKTKFGNIGFMFWNIAFVASRVASSIISFLTFFVGLEKTSQPVIDFQEGNFNTTMIRCNCLLFVLLTQAYMMWNFINFHLRRRRERSQARSGVSSTALAASSAANRNKANKEKEQRGRKGKQEKEGGKMSKSGDDEISELPEADQNQVRQRKAAAVSGK